MQCRIYKNSFQQMEVQKFELLDTNNFHNIFCINLFETGNRKRVRFFKLTLHVLIFESGEIFFYPYIFQIRNLI